MRVSFDLLDKLGLDGDVRYDPYDVAEINVAAQISIAISLKRIADTLQSTIDYRYDQPAIRTRTDS